MERARHFERLLAAIDRRRPDAVTPRLRELTVPTLLVWGTGDEFFTSPGPTGCGTRFPARPGLITVDGARLFFPDERPIEA